MLLGEQFRMFQRIVVQAWPWRWRQYDLSKCEELRTPGHGITSQKTWLFSNTAVKFSYLLFDWKVIRNSFSIHNPKRSDCFSRGATAPSGPGPPHYWGFTVTLRHTTLSMTPLDRWSAWRRDLYLTIHNARKRQTSVPPAGFEPAIPVSKWPQTHTLDLVATGIKRSDTCTKQMLFHCFLIWLN
jgi:hypothetical protein